jgi:hypothetical protein
MEGASVVCEAIAMEGIRLLPPQELFPFLFTLGHRINNNKMGRLMVWLGGICMLGYSVKYFGTKFEC